MTEEEKFLTVKSPKPGSGILTEGGGGVHSNLGCRDMFLKIVSLLQNYRSEWGKSIHFWKALCTGFLKIPKSLP